MRERGWSLERECEHNSKRTIDFTNTCECNDNQWQRIGEWVGIRYTGKTGFLNIYAMALQVMSTMGKKR
jgi:hypothetical protein